MTNITIDGRIEKQKAVVFSLKDKYEQAVKLRYYNTPRTDAEKQIERLREARKGTAIAK